MTPLKPKDVAKMLNVTVKTLQKWDRLGTFKAYRLKNNRRYYLESQVNDFLGKEVSLIEGKTIIYARVSNHGQVDDLKGQIAFLEEYAKSKNYHVDEIIKDIDSGLNYERKKWNQLLERIENGDVTKVIVAHKDRFIRFGFNWFDRYLQRCGCTLEVVTHPILSPHEEMIQDLVSIVHVFSCRIYGLRKYKDKINNDIELQVGQSDCVDLFTKEVVTS